MRRRTPDDGQLTCPPTLVLNLPSARGVISLKTERITGKARAVTMISVDKLTKQFGLVMAVDHISFEVDKGEIVGFLGPNGAGKTTTMRILTTYLPATKGIAKVAGYDVMTQSLDVRRNIGYLPESVPLYSEMRVDEYIEFRAKLKGVERKE